jgi:hypothetical protein
MGGAGAGFVAAPGERRRQFETEVADVIYR